MIAAWALIRIVTMIGSLCDQGLSDIVDRCESRDVCQRRRKERGPV